MICGPYIAPALLFQSFSRVRQTTHNRFLPISGSDRRPPKHQSHTESRAREANEPKPSRSGNIPSLVPRPPETPLVKQFGKVYSLKCR